MAHEEISARLAALQAKVLKIESYSTRDRGDQVAGSGVMPLIQRRIDALQADVAELLGMQEENDDVLKDIGAALAEANSQKAELHSSLLQYHASGEAAKIGDVLGELTGLETIIQNLVFMEQTATILRASLGSRFDMLSQIAAPASKIFSIVSMAVTEIKDRKGGRSD